MVFYSPVHVYFNSPLYIWQPPSGIETYLEIKCFALPAETESALVKLIPV